jgi:hypothetical protein
MPDYDDGDDDDNAKQKMLWGLTPAYVATGF